IDTQIYNTYTAFMSPYIQSPSNLIDVLPDHPQSLLSGPAVLMLPIRYLLQVIHVTSPILALGGGLVLLLLLFQPSPAMGQLAVSTKRLRAWLITSYNDPARRGFVLLLVWQGVLTLLLMRHSIDFYGHYATFLLPGPFILVAICLTRILAYLQENQSWWHRGARLVVYAVVGLTICANLIGSVTFVVDTERGAFNSNFSYPLYLHYTEYGEFKQAIEATDQLAQQHHISHVYLVGNPGFRESLRYFAQQMRTPTTVIGGDTHSKGTCVVLPGPGSGPVVYLVSPYTPLVNEIMQRYAHATLVQQPQRTGGDPFNLYILNARPLITPGQHVFTKTLQLLEPQAQRVNTATPWMVTHWGVTESRKAAWRTDYNYTFKATLDGQSGSLLTTECVMTAVQPGTQLFAAFKLPQQGIAPKLLNISVKQYTFQPWSIKSGPLRFEVMKQRIGVSRQLKTPGGQNTIAVSAS
ncbi:MAG: hypothetical protein J2P37_33905, partial [Ktedonobacteraceae bacterium]|nr:hypothetical protein [Ktedonobacteraceae bacterium]